MKTVESGKPPLREIGTRISRATAGSPAGFEPKTDLGRRLVALRASYIAKKGKLLSRNALQAEIARRRGFEE